MLTKQKVQTSILLFLGILILINLLSSRLFFRLDFTADQRYSLSDATEDILDQLNDPVTITAYFSEDMPPDIEKVKSDFREMLIEYSSLSGGQVVYEFINPAEDPQTEMQVQQSGVQPIMINVREKDQLKQQKAYLGAIIQLGDGKEVIPFIQPGAAMEFALSSNIKKLAVKNKPKVAFSQGNGEASLASMQQLTQQMQVMYETTTWNADTSDIPPDVNTVVVVAPKDSIGESYFNKLDNFLARGGRLLLALNRVEGNLQNAQGSAVKTGFSDWLRNKGLELEESFVIDGNAASITVRQQQGMFVMNTPVRFPYLPIITTFSEHPVTQGLEAVVLPFASPLNFTPVDSGITVTPLAMTSDMSGFQKPPVFFDINKQWRKTDFNQPSLIVGAALEGKLYGNMASKMIVFGDGDFAVNGEGQQAQQLQPDNISLMINSIDWLSDDTGLVELRTKGVTARPIDPSIEDGTKAIIKYLNFLLPILLIIVYGVYRMQVRKKIRNNLSMVDYVQ